ncbi:hypothetical protein G7Y79_00095g101330 [Physcia stellaris]|nr:hypothetical protein G7Y79_00095g101330 [Physcia stellaris]
MLGILHPSLLISVKYPEGDVVYKEGIAVYRDVNKFLANLERKTKEHSGVEPHLIARYCLQGSAGQWFLNRHHICKSIGRRTSISYAKRFTRNSTRKSYNNKQSLQTISDARNGRNAYSPSTPKQSPAASTETPKAAPAVAAMPTPPSTPKQSPAAPIEAPKALAAVLTPPATPPPNVRWEAQENEPPTQQSSGQEAQVFPKGLQSDQITSYFKPAANQKASISQGSKTPNPRSFQQLIPAESIRPKSLPPTETTSEKSRVSPYKMPSISDGIPLTPAPYHYKGHALNGGPNFCNQWTRTHQVNQSEAAHYQECVDSEPKRIYAGHYVGRHPPNTPLMALIKKTNPHTCRRCFRAFRSNNDLHGHLRCTHLEHRRRRRSTEWTPYPTESTF